MGETWTIGSAKETRMEHLTPAFVDEIPETLRPGVLYVSEQHKIATHLCASGCGYEQVTPLGYDATAWKMHRDGGTVTLSPSLLHRGCGAHYFIEENRIRWAQ